MKIDGREILETYARGHADARSSIKAWLAEVEKAEWKSSVELKKRYPKASVISSSEVYFDIRGDHYRLSVQIAYKTGVVVIEWIGTHDEYMRRLKEGK